MALCLVGVVVLLIGEIAARVFFGLGNPVIYEDHYLLGYRMKPDQNVRRRGGSPVHINSLGCRGPELDTSPDTVRVLVVGDSVTYGGYEVTDKQLYTTLLQKRLSGMPRYKSRRVQVINCGVNGYSMEHADKFLLLFSRRINPDIIIAHYPIHDFFRAFTQGKTPAFSRRKPVLALQEIWEKWVPLAWNAAFRKNRVYQARKDFINRHYDALTHYNFEQILHISNRVPDAKFIFSLSPMQEEFEKNVPDYNMRLRRDVEHFVAGHDMAYHDALPAFRKNEGTKLLFDHCHFNARGHEVMADSLADFMAGNTP